MAWIRIDDSFTDHPKVVGLSNAAHRAFITGLCYSGRYLTNGHLPVAALPKIASAKVRAELIQAGLWHKTDAGAEIHDFLEYNPSRSKVEEERAKTAARVREHRARNTSGNGVTPENGNAVTNGAPGPTRPQPLPLERVKPFAVGAGNSNSSRNNEDKDQLPAGDADVYAGGVRDAIAQALTHEAKAA